MQPTRIQRGYGARSAWIEVSEEALATNVATFREAVGPGVRLGAVVKGDAYGHGLAVTLQAVHAVVDVLYVVTAPDALAIRAWEAREGRDAREVLVIGALAPDEVVALARAGVSVVLGDPSWRSWPAALRSAGAPPVAVHVHVDSGLGREGTRPEAVSTDLADLVDHLDVLDVVGVLTHFADTEDVTEQDYARSQLAAFEQGRQALQALLASAGVSRALTTHAAASAAALVLPPSRLDVVRVGISLYGLWPSRQTRISARLVHGHLPTLRPALSWRCRSQLVKTLPAGAFVGYGCTHRCRDTTAIAVLPVGYFDGYPRRMSGRAHVLVKGRRCPVLGRVMMNHIVIDITGVPDPGDEVVATLLGEDGDERVTADDLAGWAETISYEIVARLGAHLTRRLVD